jgi:uncharacterized membrane protein
MNWIKQLGFYMMCLTTKEHSMIKTFSFAILHFSVAFSIAYLLTGSILIGGLMALIEPAINTVVFYFHERAWNHHQHAHAPVNQRDEHEWAYAA